MRVEQTLSGSWQFGIDPEGTSSVEDVRLDRQIQVPMPWQAAIPELQQYSGYAWYRRSVELDEEWLGGEVLLQFGAVDYWCQVFVNGELVGEHEGGYTPFTLPVRWYLRVGENEITVRVYDSAQEGIFVPRWPRYPDEPGRSRPPFDAENIPHGKQEWYINAGGIWQDVRLTAVPSRWIERVRITPDIRSGEARVEIELAGGHEDGASGKLGIRIGTGPGETAEAPLVSDQDLYTVVVPVENPRLWGIDDPHLYTATVTLYTEDGSRSDELTMRFGFREVRTSNGKIMLNGEPVYLLAALDQDMYPETVYTVPSEEFLRDQFRKAKELGLNCLRCHIKPPDPIYLDLADEMGLLVWEEIPSWRTFYIKGTRYEQQLDLGEIIKARVETTLREMVRRDYNHPCLIIWTIVNEDWGTTLPLSASDRRWMSHMYTLCKELDPTRLVVDNSPCPHPWGPNIHVRTDLDDFHFYTNIPDQAGSWEATMEQFNMRPLWTFSSHGDAQRTGQEPLILSEFGNWGLPLLKNLRAAHGGEDPPWFGIGPWWNSWEGEAGWPAGVEERFRRLGLDKIWGSYDQFAEATQWHQFAALKFEIEAMRRQPHITGYVITEMADIYWESNGLLDFYRNPKAYHEHFADINSPDVVVPRVDSYAYWDDQQPTVRLHVSRFGKASWEGARVRWTLGGDDGETKIPNLAQGATAYLGEQTWNLPRVAEAGIIQARVSVVGADGAMLAGNSLEMAVYPTALRRTDLEEPVAVFTGAGLPEVQAEDIPIADRPPEGIDGIHPDGGLVSEEAQAPAIIGWHPLRESVRALGYNTSDHLASETRVAVTDHPNPQLLRWVRAGGDLLFIARGPSPFFWVHSRGGAYSGAWLTSYSWIRPDIHKRLKVVNPLGMPFRHVMPSGTIVGLPVEDPAIHDDILAGMISGWVGHPAVHTVQFRYGKGRVVMTTFKLCDGLGADPAGTSMFHDLVEYLISDACQPTLRANY